MFFTRPGLLALAAVALAAAAGGPRPATAVEVSASWDSSSRSAAAPRLRALAKPPAPRAAQGGGGLSWLSFSGKSSSSLKKAKGAPVTNSELFAPKVGATSNVPLISPKIFCMQPDNTPACTGDNCCCWSTFGLPHHPAYPNPSEGQVKRQCLNPPEKFVYVTVPGEVNDEGEDEALKQDSTVPVYDGRNLCCTIPADSPEYYSQRDVILAVPTTEPPPTTSTTSPPPPTTTIITTTNPFADFEAVKMEEAATANTDSASELGAASMMLNATVTELRDTVEAQGKDPRLPIHRANIARMRRAIHQYSAREWASMEKYHEMANFKG